MFISSSRQSQTKRSEENLLVIQVSLCHILKHLEDSVGKCYLFIFIALGVTSFSF